MKQKASSINIPLNGGMETEGSPTGLTDGAFYSLYNLIPTEQGLEQRLGALPKFDTDNVTHYQNFITGFDGLIYLRVTQHDSDNMNIYYTHTSNGAIDATEHEVTSITTQLGATPGAYNICSYKTSVLTGNVGAYADVSTTQAVICSSNAPIYFWDTSSAGGTVVDALTYSNLYYADLGIVFGGSIWFARVTETEGIGTHTTETKNINRARWSYPGAYTEWTKDGVDQAPFPVENYQDFPEAIQAMKILNGNLYIFCDSSIHRVTFTVGDASTPVVYQIDYNIVPVGCKYPETIQECKGVLIFRGSDNTIRMFDGFKSHVISNSNRSLIKSHAPSQAVWDSTNSLYIMNSNHATAATKHCTLNFRLGNPDTPEITPVKFFMETYPGEIKTFASSTAQVLASMTTSSNPLVELHSIGSTKDLVGITGEAFVVPSFQTKIYSMPDFGVGTFTNSQWYGKSSNTNGQGIDISATVIDFNTSLTNVNTTVMKEVKFLNTSLFPDLYTIESMPINLSGNALYLGLSGNNTRKITGLRVDKAVVNTHNVRSK